MAEKQTDITGEDAFAGWTKAEKFYLINALKTIDRKDIAKIHEYIPTKSHEEIKAAIDYNVQLAYQRPEYVKYITKKNKKAKADPLLLWANRLIAAYPSEKLRTETAAALRVIAECEDIPSPALTENIDFREVYRQMANAMEGKPLTTDPFITAVLNKCIKETALASKAFHKHSTCKHLLNSIDLSDTDMGGTFAKPTDDAELAVLRQLTSQINYNPLKLPEAYLKPSCNTKPSPQ